MAFDKKKLRREIEAARKVELKKRLAELRDQIKAARAKRWEEIRGVQLDCRLKRAQLKESCALRRVQASEQGHAGVQEARHALDTTRRTEKQLDRAGKRPGLRSTAKERGQESDDEVRSNLPADMVRVFDAIKKHVKGSPRKSRTEAFFQWAEENPGEVYDLQQRDADRYLAQLLAEQDRLGRESRRRSTAGVPF